MRKDELFELQGVTISGGLFFVGEAFGSNKWQAENCLVRPSLNVIIGKSGDDLPYYPNYSQITPAARGAYLKWLASARDDPSTEIGLVFLYFYGLEYRLFKQGDVTDRNEILDEIERLKAVYGGNRSFSHYARSLLSAARLGKEFGEPELSPERRNSELPIEVRYWLGLRLAHGEPLNARDALLWLTNLPDYGFRTPAVRCFDYFVTLWTQRFQMRFKAGLKVSAPTTTLRPSYRSASGTFTTDLAMPTETIPDIARVSAPLRRLKDLAEECTAALEPYSRHLGRNPEDHSSPTALLLLPEELQSESVLNAIAKRVETILASNAGLTTLLTLCEVLGVKIPLEGRIPHANALQAGQILDRLGIGVEPDRRSVGSSVERSTPIVLFRSEGHPLAAESGSAYQSARTLVEVGILAAASDGNVTDDEVTSLELFIAGTTNISTAERSRLRAYGLALRPDLPKQQAIWKKLSEIDPAAKKQIAQLGVDLVLSDAHITAGEVKFLERLYSALRLDPKDVYAALHRANAKGEQDGVAGAKQRPPSNGKIIIDVERLQRLRSDTNAASSLLASIFSEDEPEQDTKIIISEVVAFPGLDAAHCAILERLISAGSLARPAFEELSRQHRVLPDGAIETINQWGFDQFDDKLLEDDDLIILVEHLRDPLTKTRVAA